MNDEKARLTEDSVYFSSNVSYSKLNNFMLYFRVRTVQFALSIELKNSYIIWFAAFESLATRPFLVVENEMGSCKSHGKVIKFHSLLSV